MTKSRFLWKLTTLWRIAYCSRPWSSRLVNPHCLEVICNACMAFRKDVFIVLIKMWSKRTAGKEDRPKSQSQSPWRKMITVILLKSRVWDYQEASWLYSPGKKPPNFCSELMRMSFCQQYSFVFTPCCLILKVKSHWQQADGERQETQAGLFKNSAYASSNFQVVEKMPCVNG